MTDTTRFPVLLTFDVDAELLWTSRDAKNWNRPIALSQGAYAYREGLPRVLNLLAKYGITCTFFVPGMIIERNRDAVQDIVTAGHEIAHHSYSHRWLEGMSEPEERDELEKTIDLIADLTGQRPAGYRAPAAEFTSNTMRLLLEYHFKSLVQLLRLGRAVSSRRRRKEDRSRRVPLRLGPRRCTVLPLQHSTGRPDDGGAVAGVRALVVGVRRSLRRAKELRPGPPSRDHRPAIPHSAARQTHRAHPGPRRRVVRALRRGGRRPGRDIVSARTAQTLRGRVAFVAGAASGIGRASARLLGSHGARLALADADSAGLAAVANELGERAVDCVAPGRLDRGADGRERGRAGRPRVRTSGCAREQRRNGPGREPRGRRASRTGAA